MHHQYIAPWYQCLCSSVNPSPLGQDINASIGMLLCSWCWCRISKVSPLSDWPLLVTTITLQPYLDNNPHVNSHHCCLLPSILPSMSFTQDKISPLTWSTVLLVFLSLKKWPWLPSSTCNNFIILLIWRQVWWFYFVFDHVTTWGWIIFCQDWIKITNFPLLSSK